MDFSQVVPFDTSKGGNTPGLCLANVCEGYSIGNKYDSAWEAWQHTQQHTDRNIPSVLAVPIFYSYTTTIDGITDNYGHINVQLPNGTVWSDGNIYASIDDYTSNKLPVFVGWGESVNDYQIIQGETMETFNEGDRVNINNYLYGKDNGYFTAQVGVDWKTAMYQLFVTGSQFDFDYKTNSGDVVNINAELGTTDAPISWNWKDLWYSYLIGDKHLPTGAVDKASVVAYIESNLN